jgi:hypothetical protein
MERDEAKMLLSRYRPGETERGNLRMAEALALVQKDPKLSEWFKRHCENIAAGSPTEVIEKLEQELAPSEAFPVKYLILGGIALAIIVGIVIFTQIPKPENFTVNYRDQLARVVQRSYPMKIAVTEQSAAREYFRTNNGAVGWVIPVGMENLPAKGAAVFTWQNHPVSLLGLQAPSGHTLFLFITEKASLIDPPVSGSQTREHIAHFDTLTWVSGNFVYMLAGPSAEELTRQSK